MHSLPKFFYMTFVDHTALIPSSTCLFPFLVVRDRSLGQASLRLD